jgi:hypothetical protein
MSFNFEDSNVKEKMLFYIERSNIFPKKIKDGFM